ncbi:MAG: TetR/AcrR family transcriptional regulator [Acidimicrobiales bacterium]
MSVVNRDGLAPNVDGRTARAMRTRAAIVDACIALVEEGALRPTASRIAERGRVSVRSIFQHFDDIEGLYAAVGDRLIARVARLVTPVDATLPLTQRIEAVVTQRAKVLEAVTPIRRAAAVHAPFSAEVRARLQSGHDDLRSELDTVFKTELDRRRGAARIRMLDAIDVLLSWPTWDSLRALNGRSPAEARAVLDEVLRALLVGEPAS